MDELRNIDDANADCVLSERDAQMIANLPPVDPAILASYTKAQQAGDGAQEDT